MVRQTYIISNSTFTSIFPAISRHFHHIRHVTTLRIFMLCIQMIIYNLYSYILYPKLCINLYQPIIYPFTPILSQPFFIHFARFVPQAAKREVIIFERIHLEASFRKCWNRSDIIVLLSKINYSVRLWDHQNLRLYICRQTLY